MRWACADVTVTGPDGGTIDFPDHPVGQEDERGGWRQYTFTPVSAAAGSDNTPTVVQQTEMTSVAIGGSSLSGTDALQSESLSYSYGAQAVQRLQKTSHASVLSGGNIVTSTALYGDTAHSNRVTGVIHDGWTMLNGKAVERLTGVFFFTNHACLADAHDAQDRVLEMHGPCLVKGLTSTDCDVDVPITQYFYNGSGSTNDAGQIAKMSQLTSGSPTSCAGAMTLDTVFSNYDALGHPQQVTDANLNVTTLTWAGSFMTSISRVGAACPGQTKACTWTFTYDNEKLTSIQYPQGNYEVLCYRSGGNGTYCDRSGGTWDDHIQWRAKSSDSIGATGNVSEKIAYAWFPDGTLKMASFTDSTGTVRRNYHAGANVLRQPTYFKAGEADAPTVHRFLRQFNAAGDVTAIGFPYNDPPDFCGTPGMVSPLCSALSLDRLGRLTSLGQTPSASVPETFTSIGYDQRGNPNSIASGCSSSPCTLNGTTYQWDDFGNLVSMTAPWLGGTSGTTFMEYDAAGHQIKKQTPQMAAAGETLTSTWDMLGRQTALTVTGPGGNTDLYRLAYDSSATVDASCPQPAKTNGQVLRRTDSFGDTWYGYDEFGHVAAEMRLRSGLTKCSGAAPQDVANTFYTWSANGNLTSINYPLGRAVWYLYGSGGLTDRVSGVSTAEYNGRSWSNPIPLVSGAVWEPYGGLRAYIIDNQTACKPTYVNYQHAKGNGSDPNTGQLGSLTVGTTPTAKDIYHRDYTWIADQVSETDTYLLGSATPRTELYAYDHLLRLTDATASNFATTGGSFIAHHYGYDGRGNRTAETGTGSGTSTADNANFTLGFDSGRVDQMISRAGNNVGSDLLVKYHYDADGRVDTMSGPNDSSAKPAWSYSLNAGPDGMATSGAEESVYKSIAVGGATYGYFYDAFNRRRAKQYPLGMTDEFYYQFNNVLLSDIGNNSTVTTPASHPVDEYVWLGGRPIAVLRSKFTLDGSGNYVRVADGTGDCTRNDSAQACGVFHIITDHIGAPVLMLDDNQLVVGEGSMNPFGAVNSVALDAETAHPYPNNQSVTLADFKQPSWTSVPTTTRFRTRLSLVDTYSSGGTIYDTINLKDGDTGAALTQSSLGGLHQGRVTSPWVVPSAGHVQVAFVSPGTSPTNTYTGVVMEGYEYQRYQNGTQPTWVPLRYPGQYVDAETGLSQNWNRFYDPNNGRFVVPEPEMAAGPSYTESVAEFGFLANAYSYGVSNPLLISDLDGLNITCVLTNSFGGGEVPDNVDAATALSTVQVQAGNGSGNKCAARGDGSFGFNASLTADVNTTYKPGRSGSQRGSTCGQPNDTLGQHEGRHRTDITNAFSDPSLNAGIQTEGFSSMSQCQAALAAFKSALDAYTKGVLGATHTLWDGCRK